MRRLTLRDIALCLRAGESRDALFDPTQTTVVPGDEPCVPLPADQLLDVDAGLSVAELTETARAAGMLTPLALLPDELPLYQIPQRFAFVADACFHSVDAVTAAGEPLHSPRAPRSAAGPDLIGATLGPHPLAVTTRVRLRAIPQSHCALDRHQGSAQQLARRVVDLVHRGEARWALLDEGALTVLRPGNGHVSGFDSLKPRPMTGTAIPAGDALALEQAARRGRVLVFPYLGRAGVLRTDAPAAVSLEAPAEAARRQRAAAQQGAS